MSNESAANYRELELVERPLDLWDQEELRDVVRDDDVNDIADLPWE